MTWEDNKRRVSHPSAYAAIREKDEVGVGRSPMCLIETCMKRVVKGGRLPGIAAGASDMIAIAHALISID